MQELITGILGLDGTAWTSQEWSFAAPWAAGAPVRLGLSCLGAMALSLWFYSRHPGMRYRWGRWLLALARGSLLSVLLLILAEPVLTLQRRSQAKPWLWLLFDGSQSMAIVDAWSAAEGEKLAQAVGVPAASLSRMACVQAWLKNAQYQEQNLWERLQEKFRLRAFLCERAAGVQLLEGRANEPLCPERLAEQLTTRGEVTALGAALQDLGRRQALSHLAGVVVFSDFNQNAGPPAVAEAERLGVPVSTVGVGPAATVDLSLDLKCPAVTKKNERLPLTVLLKREGIPEREVAVKLWQRREGAGKEDAGWRLFHRGNVPLKDVFQSVEFSFVPIDVGRYVFRAEVEACPGEVLTENNRAECRVTVHDDPFRVLFVAYEPSWEWRFVKELLYRDPLVGPRGFRTFLASADPKLCREDSLYLPTQAQSRQEFFEHDVILLGDMPASALSPRFCQWTEELVEKLGGGLIVLAGPRFGPGQLALTPLGKLLPVKTDPNLGLSQREAFRLQPTADALAYEFMHLEPTRAAPGQPRGWERLGALPWYRPVNGLSPMATALALHPRDRCRDGSPQPLVAIRRCGSGGEVVYLGFDELWRLRRGQGEELYRQFWGMLIQRLASRHALGAQKRFAVRTDRSAYRPHDQVFLSVEAYDENYQRLPQARLTGGALHGELLLPDGAASQKVQALSIPMVREGVFEAKFPVWLGGDYRVRVHDPILAKDVEVGFHVAPVSVEREQAVRNLGLQQAIAAATRGKSYDLTTAAQLADDVPLACRPETRVEVIPLANTWLAYTVVMLLLFGEWLGRKGMNLP